MLSDFEGCFAEAKAWKCDNFSFFLKFVLLGNGLHMVVARALARVGVYSASREVSKTPFVIDHAACS